MKSPAGDAGALWVCKGAGCGVAIPAVIVAVFGLPPPGNSRLYRAHRPGRHSPQRL